MPAVIRYLAIVVCALGFHCQAAAQFPERPVRLVVPFPPGGGTDAVARILGVELTKIWGQQLIVDNRAGAQGNIGTAFGAKAAADGYTLIFAHQGVLTINAHLYQNLGFDPIKDIVPVSRGTEQPFVLVVHPSLPVNSLQELTELARKQPGKLIFSSSASGPQMAGEMYKMAAGIDMLHLAYKGAGPAVIDLLAGHVRIMFANPTSVAPHVKTGKLRALAVFGNARIDILPDVPTAAEAGYPQLGKNPEWYGIAVPAGTPAGIVQKHNSDIAAALKTQEAQKAIRALGMTPSSSTPQEFAQQISTDHDIWGKVVRASGARAE